LFGDSDYLKGELLGETDPSVPEGGVVPANLYAKGINDNGIMKAEIGSPSYPGASYTFYRERLFPLGTQCSPQQTFRYETKGSFAKVIFPFWPQAKAQSVDGVWCDAGSFFSSTNVAIDSFSFIVGKVYRYYVVASNGVNTYTSDSTNYIVGGLYPPENLSLTNPYNNQVSFSWNNVPNATEYVVIIKNSLGNQVQYANVSQSANPAYTFNATSHAGETLSYEVFSAYNGTHTVNSSNSSHLVGFLPPNNFSVQINDNGDIELDWDMVSGADNYKIYQDGAFYTQVAGNSSSFSFLNPTLGAHFYEISTIMSGEETSKSGPISVTVLAKPGLSLQGGTGKVELSWTDTGVNDYVIARIRNNPQNPDLIPISGSTSYTDQPLENGNDYYYAVAASANGGQSFSGFGPLIPTSTLDIPVIEDISAQQGKIVTFNFSYPGKISVVDSFNIYRKDSVGGDFILVDVLPSGGSSNHTHTQTLDFFEGYTYKVQAVGENSLGDFSQASQEVWTLGQVENINKSVYGNSAFIGWTYPLSNQYFDSFQVVRKRGNEPYVPVGEVTPLGWPNLSYMFPNDLPDLVNEYSYCVQAKNDDPISDGEQNCLSFHPLESPIVNRVESFDNQVTIMFSDYTNGTHAESYYIYRSVDGSTYSFITSIPNSDPNQVDFTYTEQRSYGVPYMYAVQAGNNEYAVMSYYSNDSNDVTPVMSPSNVSAYAIGDMIALEWNEPQITQNLDGYEVLGVLNEKIWVGTFSGLSMRDENGAWKTYTTAEGLDSDYINAVLHDSRGNTWIGTSQGVTLIDFSGTVVDSPAGTEELEGRAVTEIKEDRFGNIWFVVTNWNVYKLDNSGFLHSYSTDIYNTKVLDLFEDMEGNIWLAHSGFTPSDDGAISKYDTTGVWNQYLLSSVSDKDFMAIEEDSSGNMWFGTLGGGVVVTDKFGEILEVHNTK
jgi:hypothetical protein